MYSMRSSNAKWQTIGLNAVETTAANITVGDDDDDDDYNSNNSSNTDIVWRTIISKQTKSGV